MFEFLTPTVIIWTLIVVFVTYGIATTKRMKKNRILKNEPTDLADADEPINPIEVFETCINIDAYMDIFANAPKDDFIQAMGFKMHHHNTTVSYLLMQVDREVNELCECINTDFFTKVAGVDTDEFLANCGSTFCTSEYTMVSLAVLHSAFEHKATPDSIELLLSSIFANALTSRLTTTHKYTTLNKDKVKEITEFFSEDFAL